MNKYLLSVLASVSSVLLFSANISSASSQAKSHVSSSNSSQGGLSGISENSYPQTITPDARHHQEIRYIAKFITDFHLAKPRIGNELSSKILGSYIDQLDSDRQYFTQADIRAFEGAKYLLDNAILTGWLKPVYQIYGQYNMRAKKRLHYSLSLLSEINETDTLQNQTKSKVGQNWRASEDDLKQEWRLKVVTDIQELLSAGKEFSSIKEVLKHRYEMRMNKLESVTSDDVFSKFTNAFTSVIDSHTRYFQGRKSVDSKKMLAKLDLVGIGLVVSTEGAYTEVSRVVEGGPADLSQNIRPGDRILKIGNTGEPPLDIIGWRLDEAVEKMRGKKGSVVELTIARDGSASKPVVVKVTRDKVALKQPQIKSRTVSRNGHEIGVIVIPRFYVDFSAKARGKADYLSISRDTAEALKKFNNENVDALVIDLSGNGGGPLDEVVKTSGLFIGKNPVLKDRSQRGGVDVLSSDREVEFRKPIVVLVDSKSAGTAEIFAAALQDYGRAIIVGRKTFGMGTVQRILDLNRSIGGKGQERRFGAIKLSIGEYYRATGAAFQQIGVTPDIEFEKGTVDELRESSNQYALTSMEIEKTPVEASDLSAVIKHLREYSPQLKNVKSMPEEKAILIAVKWLEYNK